MLSHTSNLQSSMTSIKSISHGCPILGYRLTQCLHADGGLSRCRACDWCHVMVQGVLRGELRQTCTACATTLLLEFATLSRLTGNASYESAAARAVRHCSAGLASRPCGCLSTLARLSQLKLVAECHCTLARQSQLLQQPVAVLAWLTAPCNAPSLVFRPSPIPGKMILASAAHLFYHRLIHLPHMQM